jgi:1-acyl-sn-glycerol-3-phosphate acyltransferase
MIRALMAAASSPWRAPVVWRVLMALSRVVVALFGRLRVTGDIPAELRGTPVIVASNHIGTFDPLVLVAALHARKLAPRLLAAAGLFRAPLIGPILRASGHIAVNRRSPAAAQALHEAEAALASGAVIAMYPEGRIGLDPYMWPERGKTGLARLALRTGATVVPVAQWGAHEVIAYAGFWAMVRSLLRSVVRRPGLRVNFGNPVDLSDLAAEQHGVALRATERIMSAVTDALVPLRVDEPGWPAFTDPTRTPSTARVRRARDTAIPAGPKAAPTTVADE